MSLPKPEIEKFTIGGDLSLWKMKMRALLVHQGLELALEEEDPKITGSSRSDEKMKQIHNRAHSTLILSLSDSILREISEEKIALGVSIHEHIDVFNKIILDLEGVETIKIGDKDKAFFLLSSLPKSYEGFVDTTLYGRTTLTLEDVKASLCSKEIQRHSGDLDQNPGEGLMAKAEKKKDKKKKKSKNQFKKEDESEKEKMKRRKCFYCKKTGHYIRDSAEKKRDNKEKSRDAAVASDESSYGCYQSADLLVASNGKIEGQWVLDSGCSFHMSPDKTLFIRLKKNLLSLSMLDSSGYIFKSDYGGLKVMKNSSIVMKGVKNNGLYVLEGSSVPVLSALHVISDVDKAKMWHPRLEHMSAKGLQELSKRGLLCEDKVEELKFCENCIFGKTHIMKFERGLHKSKAVLDYAHSDLWGPAQVPSLSGGRYFVTFIGDFSRKVWLYILKTKDQAFEKFKIWRALVENQFEMKLKALRTDNGLKFCNKEFDKYCQKHGITRHKTVRFTPQQNGLAERMNRTLIDKTRCLLINSKLLRSFWAKAVTIACYLVNRSPSAALKFKTHEEVWIGVSADYKHLRIFGCIAYVHVKQGKLDLRALKRVFVGYPEGVKGYKVWCGATHKCIISRDVTFHEESMLEDKDSVVFDFSPYTYESMKEAAIGKDSRIEVKSSSSSDRGDQDMGATEDLQERSEVDDLRTSMAELQDYQLARDRARRETKPPSRYAYAGMIAYALNSAEEIAIEEPASYKEAVRGSDNSNWIKAMEEEMDSLIQNKTWTLVQNPGNRRSKYDSCVYSGSSSSGGVVYLLLYVDDMLLASKDISEIKKLKDLLNAEFEMKDLGCAKRILGMDIIRDRVAGTLFVSQERYILKVLDRFDMLDAKSVQTPLGSQFKLSKVQAPVTNQDKSMMSEVPYAQAVGSLMYAMVCTRADIAYADENSIVGYVYSDFAGDLDGRKSILGYLFMVNGCLISWKATLQSVVTLSSTEAEFIAATEAVKEGKWLSGILNELWLKQKIFTIFCDNQSAIHLIKNQIYHERTKHIDVRLHFIRDEVSKGAVSVTKIHTDVNPADALTKVVPTTKFKFCVNLMGIMANL
ncbi:hypothetical protein KPL71_014688 [Citrus sinensis]|uniref:Uncharacterized protein n=1 Tax=Citrus sinensis TaxID=2711 RepID=A0ACB8KDN9_CITSI|nr:hypothetical protein KPL71_014688 [Citrus sinensis]